MRQTMNFVLFQFTVASSLFESAVDCLRSHLGRLMEFTLLFLAVAIVMLAAWRGSRTLALGLYAAVMVACAATYLHHATDTLKLSF